MYIYIYMKYVTWYWRDLITIMTNTIKDILYFTLEEGGCTLTPETMTTFPPVSSDSVI